MRLKSITLTAFIFLAASHLLGQHYYNDLVVTGDNMKKRALYEANKVKSVGFNSYDGSNQPIDGFNCSQSVSNNFKQIATTTTVPLGGTSENTSYFNAAGQLMQTVDTSDGNKTTISYTYNSDNRISSVLSESVSPGQFFSKELHLWYYDRSGKPEKMLKIKNGHDTTYVGFVLDPAGNVEEEKSIYKGLVITTYYYYDNKNHLTDIVRYNPRVKKMLPDYIFEYDAQDRLATMLVVPEGSDDYQKWYYSYDEKGLKIMDRCFSKSKVLIGKIEYRYQF